MAASASRILSTQVPVDPVKAVSVAPAAVSGNTQTLTLTYSDVAGVADLAQASLWIKGAAGLAIVEQLHDRVRPRRQRRDQARRRFRQRMAQHRPGRRRARSRTANAP